MQTLPAHIRAALAGAIHARAVTPIAPVADCAPVFEPAQRARAASSRCADAIGQSEEIECHEGIEVNCDHENFALSITE